MSSNIILSSHYLKDKRNVFFDSNSVYTRGDAIIEPMNLHSKHKLTGLYNLPNPPYKKTADFSI